MNKEDLISIGFIEKDHPIFGKSYIFKFLAYQEIELVFCRNKWVYIYEGLYLEQDTICKIKEVIRKIINDSYMLGRNDGYEKCQYEIKKVLGI